MVRRRIGEPDPQTEETLQGVEEIDVEEDELELEHMKFLSHHPGFRSALSRLREDLELGAGLEWSSLLQRVALADPGIAPLPARRFAAEWGLSVASVYYLALSPIDKPETVSLAIKTTPLEWIIRVPRPLTPARRKALENWIKSEKSPGPIEETWQRIGKSRSDPSPELVAALPYFDQWNDNPEVAPAQIYQQLSPEEFVNFEKFHSTLVRVWKRMRAISPDGIRPGRPSKAQA